MFFLKHRLYPFVCDVIAFFVYPIVRVFGRNKNVVTVLLYHNVSEDSPVKSARYMNVTPEVFAAQIASLHSGAFELVDGDKFLSFIDGKYRLSKPGVLITFDDGFRGFHRYALPVIDKGEMPVLLFVPTDFIGGEGPFPWLAGLKFNNSIEYPKSWYPLEYEQLADSEYVRIGGHGASHNKLGRMSYDDARAEISRCFDALNECNGVAPIFFAYPQGIAEYGDWTTETNDIVRECGFKAAFNSHVGRVKPGDNKYSLCRIAVNGYDSAAILKRKIYGAYDWVYYLQRFIHKIIR